MLDVPIMRTNAPKEHQRVIRKLTTGLDFLYISGSISYEPFPETMIDESKTSATPDVLLFDSVSEKNVMFVEVTIPASGNDDFEKVAEIVKRYQIQEGFTYNYKTYKWRKYKLNIGEITKNQSFCDSIGYDLNDFLK